MGKIVKGDMDELFNGLVTPVSIPSEVIEQPVADKKSVEKKAPEMTAKKIRLKDKEKICANISIEKMEKIRALSKSEGLTITDTIEACLDLAIKTYEEKNGVIRVKAEKKGDASKIFG